MPVVISAKVTTPQDWRLTQLNGQDVLAGTEITLHFGSGQISGFAGCNNYNGGYTASQTGEGTYNVTITGITTGQMACPEDVMNQESTYLSMLQSATSAQFQGDTLNLNTSQGSLNYTAAVSVTPY